MSEITEQRDPSTTYLRTIPAIMEQMRSRIQDAGIPAHIYRGTNLDDLSRKVSTALTESGGRPSAIVCFAGSDFANHPRRTSRFNVVLVSGDTRPLPGMFDAISAAWTVEEVLDRLVTQETSGECPITDILQSEGGEAVQLKDLGAASAIVVSVIVKDY